MGGLVLGVVGLAEDDPSRVVARRVPRCAMLVAVWRRADARRRRRRQERGEGRHGARVSEDDGELAAVGVAPPDPRALGAVARSIRGNLTTQAVGVPGGRQDRPREATPAATSCRQQGKRKSLTRASDEATWSSIGSEVRSRKRVGGAKRRVQTTARPRTGALPSVIDPDPGRDCAPATGRPGLAEAQ